MSEKLRTTIIVECDATTCEFANGDIIAFNDDVLNCTGCTYKNGVSGYCQSFDWYDAKSEEWFCGYELFQAFSGHIYNLVWYDVDFTEYETPYISDFEYSYDKCLATLPTHPTIIDFWHAIYDAIQQL